MFAGANHLARRLFIVLALIGLLPTAARSTTFVAMDEPTLLHSSAVVLVGTVTAIESGAADDDSVIFTYVHIQPERIIKGALSLAPLVIREPGGTVGERRQVVFGSPEFWVGERALLFLSRNSDGTLQTNSLAMGKFSLIGNAYGHMTAERDFGFGASMLVPSSGEMIDAPRQAQRFLPLLRRLRRLAHTERVMHRPAAPVTLVPEELRNPSTRFQEAYTFLSNPPARWFQPDSGQPVTYYIDSTGDRTLGLAASQAALDAAFAAWTNVSTSNLVLQDGGTTTPAPFGPCDMNRITFNDPYSEVTDPSGCSGVLAIGGYCGGGGTRVVNGTTFGQITIGKVTFNNGWAGCSSWNQCNVAEVATHEIGHTIGLGHSSVINATMYAMAHFDGRCASVMTDDINGVSFIYPQTGTPPPTATPTAVRSNTPTATRTPTVTPRVPTATRTWTRIPTRTPTRTVRPTNTRVAATPTWTRIPTRTPTMTMRPTNVGVPATATATRPPVPTATRGATVANDSCISAIAVTVSPFTSSLNTIAATRDVTDPVPACALAATARTVWYRYTAPRAGVIVASTSGSNYDTVLSAYTGACGGFNPVPAGCNDNMSWLLRQSQITFTAAAGQTYYFMVSTNSLSPGGTTAFRLVLN